MVGAQDRPVPRPGAIDPTERTEILRELLTVERARLANALDLERQRHIVFPETTVIIKDIERLIRALQDKDEDEAETSAPKGLSDDERLEAMLAELR